MDLDHGKRRKFVTGDHPERPKEHDAGGHDKPTINTQIVCKTVYVKCLKESNSQKHKVEVKV